MKKLIKKILIYFRSVEIFESKIINNSTNYKFYKLHYIKSLNKINRINKDILDYFIENKEKKIRFKKKQYFLALTYKQDVVCSGWIFKGRYWKITEIDLKIKINNALILFDFITPKEHRSKGNYKKILKMIAKRFNNKKLLIYTLSSNKPSLNGIKNAGFVFKEKLNYSS